MIVPDINLLVYAHNVGVPQYHPAQRWWQALVDGSETVGIPWIVATGFIRVASNQSLVSSRFTPAEVAEFVANWFGYSHIGPIDPGPGHMDLFRQCLGVLGSGPNLVPDAHIAALAMEYDAEVHSADSDFGRFPGVRWHNPLA